jgi:hypothetical protein
MAELTGAPSCEGVGEGDVVITEVMANPRGPDEGHEWIELHNPGPMAIALDGVRLEASRADGSGARSFVLDDLELEPGGWLVLGDSRAEPLPAHLDRSYGPALGALRNSDARVAVHCGDTVVDEMAYARTRDGHALVLDGALPPARARREPARWCHAEELEYEPGNFGTPGGANETCAAPAVPKPDLDPGACLDGGEPRPREVPGPGDLLITAVMANTSSVPDATGEWFEVLVTRPVDLGGLEVGTDPDDGPRLTLEPADCQRAEAGARILFARSADPSANGGLPPVDHGFSFFLVNSGGSLYLAHGGHVLDVFDWERSVAGVAAQRDDAGQWCDASEPYGDGDLGSPGAPNPDCADPHPGEPGPGDEGETPAPDGGVVCRDGDTWRPVAPPVAGDLRIHEVMANSAQVPDVTGEWFELVATRPVDLAGLEVGTHPEEGPRVTLDPSSCHRVEAGDLVLFARSEDPALNGGLPPVDHTFRFFLVNANGRLYIGHGGEVLDEMAWTTTSSGVAWQRDGEDRWCDAAVSYGDGDLGTPGEPNPSCP